MALQDGLVDLARRAGFACRKEAVGLDSRRPGDVFFPRWDAEGLTVVDVTIWHPLAPSAPVESRAGVEQWRTRQAEDKRAKYEADRGRLGWKFVPFAVDTFGGLGKGGL